MESVHSKISGSASSRPRGWQRYIAWSIAFLASLWGIDTYMRTSFWVLLEDKWRIRERASRQNPSNGHTSSCFSS